MNAQEPPADPSGARDHRAKQPSTGDVVTEQRAIEWDTIIIGGSAAGLSAALMLGRARRRVLVIDAGNPRNRFAAHMHGVLGHEGRSPRELVEMGRREAAEYGVEFLDGTVERVEEIPNGLRVVLGDSGTAGEAATAGDAATTHDAATIPGDAAANGNAATHDARTLIAATGITDELPEIPGLAERWGTSVLHCPYCHGWEVRDQRLAVLATSSAALHQVKMVRQWSDDVTLFSAMLDPLDPDVEAELRARDVRIVNADVTEVLGTGTEVRDIRTTDGETVEADAIFTAGVPRPHDGFLSDLNLDRDVHPFGTSEFVSVDQAGKTSHGRVWAVGNVVDPMANVPFAIGAGALTGSAVNGALVEEDFTTAASFGPLT